MSLFRIAILREWVNRLFSTLGSRRSDTDIEQELREHLELAAADAQQKTGVPGANARDAAIRTGGIGQAMEAMRDQRSLPWIGDAVRDVRHAVRLLVRNPVFAVIAVLSIAVGVGANCAIFSLADALMLRPLPVRDPSAIVTIHADTPEHEATGGRMSYPNYRDLRAGSTSFDGLAAYQITSASFARARDDAREMRVGMLVSDNFFGVLDVAPIIGRVFAPEEARVAGRDAVVVLDYDFWANALGADRSILDGVVWMNGIDFHVIGVAPPNFDGTEPPVRPAFYVPLAMAERLSGAATNVLDEREVPSVTVKGRLKAGISLRSARAELALLWNALAEQFPDVNRNRIVTVRGEIEERIRQDPWDATLLLILGALAAVVLVIACANVANLMLGRARARSREMAIRLALGVGRGRLLRQLFTEGVVLAVGGLVGGVVLAFAAIQFLRTIPVSNQVVIAPQLDGRVLVFGLTAAAVSAILFGLAPARQSLKTDLVPALKTSELAETRHARIFGRSALVVAQIAASMVLLIAMGMLLDGFQKAVAFDPGFRTDHLMMLTTNTSLVRYTVPQTRAFYRELAERARALPGVVSATLASAVPFDNTRQESAAVVPDGYQLPRGQQSVSTSSSTVDDAYFSTMHIEIVRGRAFNAGDTDTGRPVAIVNEEFAKTYWPNQDALGKRIGTAEKAVAPVVVVGIAKTGKYVWIGEAPTPFLYFALAQHPKARLSLLAETRTADPSSVAAPLRDIVRALDVNQPIFNMQPFATLYRERAVAVPLMVMKMVGTMGVLGLALALIGLYGLVAYSVARRTREIGIRLAIGAGRSTVMKLILGQGLMLSIAGIAIGGVVSVAVARLLAAALVGLGAPNPLTYVIVPVALVSLTVVATYFPARRASLVDPLVALRDE